MSLVISMKSRAKTTHSGDPFENSSNNKEQTLRQFLEPKLAYFFCFGGEVVDHFKTNKQNLRFLG